jgi:hypothetical protein
LRERRRSERTSTASIPVQLSEINGELIDLSLTGAAVVHRSPFKSGASATLIFPSYGGIYIPCQVLRSVVQVRRNEQGSEYVFRSAIVFHEIPPDQKEAFREFLEIQIARLREKQVEAAKVEDAAGASSANVVADGGGEDEVAPADTSADAPSFDALDADDEVV